MKRLTLYTSLVFSFGILLPLFLSICGILGYDYHCDFVSQQIAFIYEIKRMLASGTPWWSWNTYLGDNFIGEYSYYGLFSPFTWLCCLFPYKYLPYGILLSVYLKTIATALFGALYFRRMNTDHKMAIAGGLLYAFSSFYIINLFYGMFCEAMMIYPILLICIENILSKKKHSFVYLALITFVMVSMQYYCAVASLLCAGIYLLCRIICESKYRSLRNFMVPSIAMIFGIAMSSVVLIPTLIQISGGNRIYSEPMGNLFGSISFAFYHIFWAIIPKVSESLPPSFPYSYLNSTSLFLQVIGLSFALIYVMKNKRSWLSICIIIYTLLYLTPLNAIFTLFTKITYTRWLYAFILLLILASIHGIEKYKSSGKPINIYIIISSLFIVTGVFLSIYLKPASERATFNIREILELFLGFINLVLLFILTRKSVKFSKLLIPAISVTAILNLCAFMYLLSGGTNYGNENKNLLSDYIIQDHNSDSSDHFTSRTDYVHPVYVNLSLLENQPSTTLFHSLFNKNILEYIGYVKDGGVSAMSYPIKVSRESLAALLSVEKVIKFNQGENIDTDYSYGLSLCEKSDKYSVYTFDYHIPMGMTYDSYITRQQLYSIKELNASIDLNLMMLDNIVINDCDEAEISKYLKKSQIDPNIKLDSIVNLRRQYIVDFNPTTTGYRLSVNDNSKYRMAFISTPCDKGFSATIDGNPTKIHSVNMGMSGIIIPPGEHEIIATYTAPGLKTGAIISIISFMILLAISFISSKAFYSHHK